MESIESKLRHLLVELDLELYLALESSGETSAYLKPYLHSAFPGDELTKAIYPSRFSYLKEVFEEEFGAVYLQYLNAGILHYELVNLCSYCRAHFDEFGFPAAEVNRLLRYLVTAEISDYLEGAPYGV